MQVDNENSTEDSNNINNGDTNNISDTKNKVFTFVRRNFKQPLSRYTNDSAVIDSMKSYGNILQITVRDVFRLFRAFFSLIYSSTFGFFSTLRLFKKESNAEKK